MQYRVQRVSEVSRHAFQNLVALWLTIIFLTCAAAFLVSMGSAKADIILPLPKAQTVYEPAVIRHFSPSPTPTLVQERCHPHLSTHTAGNVQSNLSSRIQRKADTQGLQTIEAIKAYRHCVSQIALDQLASSK